LHYIYLKAEVVAARKSTKPEAQQDLTIFDDFFYLPWSLAFSLTRIMFVSFLASTIKGLWTNHQ
jgi:hypothetical protein